MVTRSVCLSFHSSILLGNWQTVLSHQERLQQQQHARSSLDVRGWQQKKSARHFSGSATVSKCRRLLLPASHIEA